MSKVVLLPNFFKSSNVFFVIFLLFFVSSCKQEKSASTDGKASINVPKNELKFSLIPTSQSNVNFTNVVENRPVPHFMNFGPIFNGGAVAVGDFNKDGLDDFYVTGNEVSNKLYINKGDFKFEDVTEKAGVGGGDGWHFGASVLDINNDGNLDIYVCRGGGWWQTDKSLRTNLLYVSNGDMTFTEKAAEYGLNDTGYGFQPVFFDYDNDNDLDLYIINHPKRHRLRIPEYQAGAKQHRPDEKGKLYKNNGNGTFSDVTIESGLGGAFGFGLSVTCADLDGNGFTDIYVSNDYTQRDFMFMNNGNGTFRDQLFERTKHIPLFAMGTDIADFNNDGFEDIYSVEMLPTGYKKSKTSMAAMNTARFEKLVDNGFHHQYMHNMLQMNQGNGNFSEVAQFAGVAKTDWSWACFLTDFDNDGDRDLFVSNGYKVERLDQDAGKIVTEYLNKNKIDKFKMTQKNVDDLSKFYKYQKVQNQFFTNVDGQSFKNTTASVLPQKVSFSNGSALADLDNDGDLDIIVNNFDEPIFIYENNASTNGNNYLRVKMVGPPGNLMGVGAKVKITANGKEQFFQTKTSRGYLSSTDPIAHFGLGAANKVDKIEVEWPDKKVTVLNNQEANKLVEVPYSAAQDGVVANTRNKGSLVKDITKQSFVAPYKHNENKHEDFKLQILLPHRMSTLGPFVSVADVNGDGLEDFYVGGAHKSAGKLYVQNAQSKFSEVPNPAFQKDKEFEDMGSHFFDADGDKDLDLYIVSGGTEKFQDQEFYNDRLYLNDGKGKFTRENKVMKILNSGSCVNSSDFDGDGDQDLFVGGRVIPELYPIPPGSYLLRNEEGIFNDVGKHLGEGFKKQGMVTDAIWADVNGDNREDLITIGEWMPIKVFVNQLGQALVDQTSTFIPEKTTGWWNSIEKADLDGDGDLDFIVGNLGENYKFKASEKKPFKIYATDFDQNGTCDVLLAKYSGDKEVPVRGRMCMSQQMPGIAETFPTYSKFADAGMDDILGEKKTAGYNYEAVLFSSIILWNDGGKFRIEKLPKEAQISPINGIVPVDINKDGKLDLITAGNMYGSEIETTRADAGIGSVLINEGGSFKSVPASESGLFLQYDVKDLQAIKLANGKQAVLAGCNNDLLRLVEIQ